jgi:release factor glutamine methyltransferase
MDHDQLRFQKTILLSRLFGISQANVALKNYELSDEQQQLYVRKCVDLENGTPFDYVTGELKTENGYRFLLDQSVLIPRPETEELIEIVKNRGMQELIVDVGTGSGFIGIQLAKYAKKVFMTDVSPEVLGVCAKNIELNRVQNAQLFNANLLNDDKLREKILLSKSWTLVANLPYVPIHEKQLEEENNTVFEPDLALYSGVDGLDLFREILEQLHLSPLPKCCFFELDDRNIHDAEKLLSRFYSKTEIRKDMNGLGRFLIGKYPLSIS